MNPVLVRRVGIAALFLAVWRGAEQVLLPGLDPLVLGDNPRAAVSVASLGVVPWLSAAIVVELASLLRARWRALRVGGPDGREALERVTRWLWLVFATVQGLALCVSTEAMRAGLRPLVAEPGWGFRVVGTATLVAGSALVLLLARVNARHGSGNLLVLGPALHLLPRLDAAEVQWPGLVAAFAVVGAATWWFLRRLTPGIRLRASVGGVLPVQDGGAVALGVSTATGSLVGIGGFAAIAAGFTVLYALLFTRPAPVSRATGHTEAEVRAALPWVVGYSLLYTGVLLLPRALGVPWSGVSAAMLFAIAWDLREEWRALGVLEDPVAVWPFHQVYAVDPALAALREAGIPAAVRGMRVRQLLQFFAPWVPIEVLVPAARADEARALLAARAR